ncbi:MAG: type IX secretion system outer membrane channel protein PorV [Bacteroidales bacterium]|nr:type IX secretion system outer membrane channel protein PorV [Bacteroidales bacterium]
MKIQKKPIALTAFILMTALAFAQLDPGSHQGQVLRQEVDEGSRIIATGVPLLLIAPDSRAGSMGDLGVASSPDANSNHWNAAKLPFADKKFGASFTYSPWLRDLGVDIDLAYLAGYYKLNDRSAIGASLTYFSLGNIEFFDNQGNSLGIYNPNEFALDMSYSLKVNENLSLSATGRYIRSDLTQGQNVGTISTHAGNAFAADIGLYFQKDIAGDKPQQYALGAQISNLGNKISYSDDDIDASFLPANLRLGGRYTYFMDQFNKISFLLDFNKLLVPTPPVRDSAGEIFEGYDNNVGVIKGALQSFYDAPGGFSEELKEVNVSAGAEYWYNNLLAVRAGYFYENKRKGNRQYLTLGLGLKYNSLGIDISYLVPTSQTNNPLKNTLRVSLSFDM